MLILKSVLHDNQLTSYNYQLITKNVGTDDVPIEYQPLTQNNDMDVIITELNKSPSGVDKSNEAINSKVVKHRIINPVESIFETSKNEKFNSVYLTQNIDFSISSTHSSKSHAENKSWSQKTLDQTDKPPFDKVTDNSINQLIVLIENLKSLQCKHKELFVASKN